MWEICFQEFKKHDVCLILKSNKYFFLILFQAKSFYIGSHHVRLAGCALSSATKYRTPLYDLRIDTQDSRSF